MLRRSIPVSVFVLGVLGLLLIAESASARPYLLQNLRNRWNGNGSTMSTMVVEQPAVAAQPVQVASATAVEMQPMPTYRSGLFRRRAVSYYSAPMVMSQPMVVSQPIQQASATTPTVVEAQPVAVMQPSYRTRLLGRRRGMGTYYSTSTVSTQPSVQPMPAMVGRGYRAYYVTPHSGIAQDTAQVNVSVPANAEIWFDGQKTTQTGALRQFSTPQLTSGKELTYEIKASWKENGRTISRTRTVAVKGNQIVEVDFTKPTAEELRSKEEKE